MKARLREAAGLVVTLLMILTFRYSIAEPYVVPTGSMEPTILPGDRLVVSKLAYDLKLPFTDVSLVHLGEPRRGDIVVFRDPRDASAFLATNLVKRVIGLPGDVIEVTDGYLRINGRTTKVSVPHPAESHEGPALVYLEDLEGREHEVQRLPHYRLQETQRFEVPAGHYFFMGDNRDNSSDSRVWGFVPQNLLKGKALFVWLSLDNHKGWLPHPRWERFGHRL